MSGDIEQLVIDINDLNRRVNTVETAGRPWVQDSATLIRYPNNIQISGNLFVDGKIGVGTTSPDYKLVVRHDAQGTGGGTPDPRIAGIVLNNQKVTNPTAGNSAFVRYTLVSDGTVGGGVPTSGELGYFGFQSPTDSGTTLVIANRTIADTAGITFFTRDGTHGFRFNGKGGFAVGSPALTPAAGAISTKSYIASGGAIFADYELQNSAHLRMRQVTLASDATGGLLNISGSGGGTNCMVFIGQDSAIAGYITRGGNQLTQEAFDPDGGFTPTAGTAGKTNIYWSSANNRYEIQNKNALTTVYTIWYFAV